MNKPLRFAAAGCLLLGGVVWAAAPAAKPPAKPVPVPVAKPPLPPMPTDAECLKLPMVKPPFAFGPGEELEFDIDAMGANAGKLFLRAMPLKNGVLPISVEAKTNTLFSKVRRVSGGGTSFLSPKDLHPVRYNEDTLENEVRRTADVQFKAREKLVNIQWTYGEKNGTFQYKYANDGLDLAGAVYLMRQLPMAEKQKVCFDVYGIRRLWRVDGLIEGKEHVSLPLGEYDAWHLSGTAIRTDAPQFRREIHVWISDDARRLPLAALGVIDLGAVRATLSSYKRPGEKSARADGAETLKW